MMDLNGHEAGNGGHSQGKSTVHRVSSTRHVSENEYAVTNLAAKLEAGRKLEGVI